MLKVAEQALADGECVIIYPEGTATRDPDQWPMIAKTGVARLALATGVPVIPVAQWGAQDILPYGEVKPHVAPRKLVRMLAGPPVDLSEYEGTAPDPGRPARGHERHHERHRGPAGRAPRRAAARRALPPGRGPPRRAPGGPASRLSPPGRIRPRSRASGDGPREATQT